MISIFDIHSSPTQTSGAEVGGKALNLMRMADAGLHVPGGIVLPVDFFAPWFEELRRGEAWGKLATAPADQLEQICASLREQALDLELDPAQAAALTERMAPHLPRDLGPDSAEPRFCVRSSSPREDLAGASFAGIYESVLGVGASALEPAIRRVFASCLDARVTLYERQQGRSDETPKIAVVIQAQIDSEKAGVGFSLGPLSNDYDAATFSANWGQGETVVAGLASPDAYVVDKHSLEIRERTLGAKETSIWLAEDGRGTCERRDPRHAELCLSDDELLELTAELRRVEDFFAAPTDIEWAFAAGQLHLLQARPITTHHPLAEELLTRPGQPRRLYLDVTMSVQGLFEPISPLGISLFRAFVPHMIDELFSGGPSLPAPQRAALSAASNGRIYADLTNVVGLVGRERLSALLGTMDALVQRAFVELELDDFAPGELRRLPLALAALARSPRRIPAFLRARRNPLAARARWHERWPLFQAELDALAARMPLGPYVEAAAVAMSRFVLRETLPLFPVSKLALARIRKLFPDPNEATSTLLGRLDQALPGNLTVEMGHAMYRLHEHLDPAQVRDLDGLVRAIDAGELSEDFQLQWSRFLARYGHRGMREIDVAAPRFRDEPALLLRQVVEFLHHDASLPSPLDSYAAAQREREEAAQTLAATLSGRQRARFEALVTVVETLGGFRETHKFVVVFTLDKIRQRILAEAQALVERGLLERPEEVFMLDLGALVDAADGDANTPMDLRTGVEEARARRVKDAQCRQVFPLIDSRGRFHRPPPRPAGPGELVGSGVSSGSAVGPVKVLRTPDEKPLLRGDVLVARGTDPSWTPLFVNAAAIVVEIGGPLQHGALVAREYGKPCVCGIQDATERLKDGDLVEVDGDTGIVRVLGPDEPDEPH